MKKTIAIVALVVLVAVASVLGTMAYLTSTDNETNTFTVGNVKIDLIEQQRKVDADGKKTTELEDFEQNKKLYPIVGSAQGEKDAIGMPTAKNYVDKMITVKNDGLEDAYIRVYFAIPSALDDGEDTFNAGLNTLHFNFGNKVVGTTVSSTFGSDWTWTNKDGGWNYFETTIDSIKYNVYFADYNYVVKPKEVTTQCVQGVYLDKSFEMKEDGAYAFGAKLDLDAGWDWNKVSCPVYAVACQAEGFANANEAITAAFGANYNPWN